MRISFTAVFHLIAFFLCFNLSAGYTELAGDLPKIITADRSPYLVIADIVVPAGKVVRIEAGTTLLFKNFTGVHVQGLLMVNGTGSQPVLFTSENDRKANPGAALNPTPYDWNGIYIHKDGIGTDLQHMKVQYSVKGIISETRFIRIAEGIFFENGRSHLSIEGVEKPVMESAPYSYSLDVKDAMIDGVPVKILHDARKRNWLRYCGLGLFSAGAAAGTFATLELINSRKEYRSLQDRHDIDNLARKNGNAAWTKARRAVNRNIILTASSCLFLSSGAAAFIWSFTF